jgi:hypothetical protein
MMTSNDKGRVTPSDIEKLAQIMTTYGIKHLEYNGVKLKRACLAADQAVTISSASPSLNPSDSLGAGYENSLNDNEYPHPTPALSLSPEELDYELQNLGRDFT